MNKLNTMPWMLSIIMLIVALASMARAEGRRERRAAGRARKAAAAGNGEVAQAVQTGTPRKARPRAEVYQALSSQDKQAVQKAVFQAVNGLQGWGAKEKATVKKSMEYTINQFNKLGEAEQQALLTQVEAVKALPEEQKRAFVTQITQSLQADVSELSTEEKQKLQKGVSNLRHQSPETKGKMIREAAEGWAK
jgi:hypothetical protein